MSKTDNAAGQYQCATCGAPLNIIEILSHGCDTMLSAQNLSRNERNTLMYIEARVVDHRGILDLEQMNHEDHSNIKLFSAADMLDMEEPGNPLDMTLEVTKFTDAAWDLARDCRQMRAIDWIDREGVELT